MGSFKKIPHLHGFYFCTITLIWQLCFVMNFWETFENTVQMFTFWQAVSGAWMNVVWTFFFFCDGRFCSLCCKKRCELFSGSRTISLFFLTGLGGVRIRWGRRAENACSLGHADIILNIQRSIVLQREEKSFNFHGETTPNLHIAQEYQSWCNCILGNKVITHAV